MIVAVTPQQVRMLGQWRKRGDVRPTTAALPLPEAQTRIDAHDDAVASSRARGEPLSPAVTWLRSACARRPDAVVNQDGRDR